MNELPFDPWPCDPHRLAGETRKQSWDGLERDLQAYMEEHSIQTPEAVCEECVKRLPGAWPSTRVLVDEVKCWESARAANADFPLLSRLCSAFERALLLHLVPQLEEQLETDVFPLVHAGKSEEAARQLTGLLEAAGLLDDRLLARLIDDAAEAEASAGITVQALEKTSAIQRLGPLAKLATTLAQRVCANIDANRRRYRVRALFAHKYREDGEVRDIWFLVGRKPMGGRVVPPAGGWPEGVKDDFIEALETGRLAACQYLREKCADPYDYDVYPLFAAALDAEGSSIGLAAAVAIVARAVDRRVNDKVAVTGALTGSTTERVGDIAKKLQGAIKEGIDQVVVPDANFTEAYAAARNLGFKGTVISFGNLRASLTPVTAGGGLPLMDPWERYLLRLKETTGATLLHTPICKSQASPTSSVCLLVCPYPSSASDTRKYLDAVAREFASFRTTPPTASPVPFHLNIKDAADPIAHIKREFSSYMPPDVPLEEQCREGAVFLINGSDFETRQCLKEAWHVLKSRFPRSRFLFACSEGTAAALADVLGYPAPSYHPAYHHRSDATLLANHVSEFRLDQPRDDLWLCEFDRTRTARDYFYGGTAGSAGLHEDLPLKRLGGIEESTLNALVEAAGHPNKPRRGPARFLILGDAATGKTASLLKLACDCLYGSEDSRLKTFVPWYLKLKKMWAPDGPVSTERFEEQVAAMLGWGGEYKLRTGDLRFTPRLLVLLDGLDEIRVPKTESASVAAILSEFVHKLHSSSIVVCTSRTEEVPSLGHRPRFERFLEVFAHENRWQIGELPWGEQEAVTHLRKIGRTEEDARDRLRLLEAPDLLRRPAFLFLLGDPDTTDLERELKLAGLERLNKGLLYKVAAKRLLRRELDRLPFYCPNGEDTLIRLLGCVAYSILADHRGIDILAVEGHLREALSIWNWSNKPYWHRREQPAEGAFLPPYAEAPDWWPRRRTDTDKVYGYGGKDREARDELTKIIEAVQRLPLLRR